MNGERKIVDGGRLVVGAAPDAPIGVSTSRLEACAVIATHVPDLGRLAVVRRGTREIRGLTPDEAHEPGDVVLLTGQREARENGLYRIGDCSEDLTAPLTRAEIPDLHYGGTIRTTDGRVFAARHPEAADDPDVLESGFDDVLRSLARQDRGDSAEAHPAPEGRPFPRIPLSRPIDLDAPGVEKILLSADMRVGDGRPNAGSYHPDDVLDEILTGIFVSGVEVVPAEHEATAALVQRFTGKRGTFFTTDAPGMVRMSAGKLGHVRIYVVGRDAVWREDATRPAGFSVPEAHAVDAVVAMTQGGGLRHRDADGSAPIPSRLPARERLAMLDGLVSAERGPRWAEALASVLAEIEQEMASRRAEKIPGLSPGATSLRTRFVALETPPSLHTYIPPTMHRRHRGKLAP